MVSLHLFFDGSSEFSSPCSSDRTAIRDSTYTLLWCSAGVHFQNYTCVTARFFFKILQMPFYVIQNFLTKLATWAST